jgi:hypothetical protein
VADNEWLFRTVVLATSAAAVVIAATWGRGRAGVRWLAVVAALSGGVCLSAFPLGLDLSGAGAVLLGGYAHFGLLALALIWAALGSRDPRRPPEPRATPSRPTDLPSLPRYPGRS